MKNFNRDRKFGKRKSNERDSGRSDRRNSGRFERRDSGSSNRNLERRDMHEVTCDECGESCKVPFKPTRGKPVYCSDCFRKGSNSGSANSPNQSKKDFDKINQKLDKILKALKIN